MAKTKVFAVANQKGGVGKSTTVYNLGSSILFPLFLQAFSRNGVPSVQSPMASVLIAGTLLGDGTGLVLRSGASAGGFFGTRCDSSK